MKLTAGLQPDQQPAHWDNHVAVYEAAFEPLTDAFARHALKMLDLNADARLIDIGAGSGGAALMAAQSGADVLAVDASQGMVERIRQRAKRLPISGQIRADVMDGMALAVPDACFDAAISIFGVILFPQADIGMREIARVLKPGGRAAVVAWTQPERYELAARLLAAIAEIRGPQQPPPSLPAQLRFCDEAVFRGLFTQAGLSVADVVLLEERWKLPSARWIADRIAFAPGMAAMAGALGGERAAVLDAFVTAVERRQGRGEIALSAVAHMGIAAKPRA